MTIVRDVNGRARTRAWLESVYGPVQFLLDPEAEFELHEVWAMCDPDAGLPEGDGPTVLNAVAVRRVPFARRIAMVGTHVDPGAVIVVHVEDENGEPLPGIEVARWWNDPDLAPLPAGLATWKASGVTAWTNVDGDVGFGMGGGDYYQPDERMAESCVWPKAGEGLGRIGMVWATSHWTVWPVFRRRSDTPVVPPPEEPMREQILARVAVARVQLDEIEILLGGGAQ